MCLCEFILNLTLSVDENQSLNVTKSYARCIFLSITCALFTLRRNSNHGSIDRTLVHLTSGPFDRSMVIVVRDACNSCPLELFKFNAFKDVELKMFCRF